MGKAEAILAIATTLEEAIKASGPNGIPSGHLYSHVMNHLSLDEYNVFIGVLKEAGKITESHFLLRHTGFGGNNVHT